MTARQIPVPRFTNISNAAHLVQRVVNAYGPFLVIFCNKEKGKIKETL